MESHHRVGHVLILILSILSWLEATEIRRELYNKGNCYGRQCEYNDVEDKNEYKLNAEPNSEKQEPDAIDNNNYVYPYGPWNNVQRHNIEESNTEQEDLRPTPDYHHNSYNNNEHFNFSPTEESSDSGFEDSPNIPPTHSRNGYILSPNIFDEQIGDASEYVVENSKEGFRPNSGPLPIPLRKEGSLIYYVGFPNQIQYFRGYPHYPRVSENRYAGEEENAHEEFRHSKNTLDSKTTDEAKAKNIILPKVPIPRGPSEYQEPFKGESGSGTVPHAFGPFKDFQGVSKSKEVSSTNPQKITTSTYSPKNIEHRLVESSVSTTTSTPHFLNNPINIIPTTTTLSPMEVYYMYKANPENSPQNFGGYQFSTFGSNVPNDFNYFSFGGGGVLNQYGLITK